jgi:phytoene dehydrogenase-like protein
MKTYDLVVLGSGTAAQVASARVRKAGRTVAVVDYRPFGGTCALRGCDGFSEGDMGPMQSLLTRKSQPNEKRYWCRQMGRSFP